MKDFVSKARLSLPLLAVLVAALISGCGGDDDSTTTATVSKAQFVKEADAICKKTELEQEKLVNKYYVRLNPNELKAKGEKLVRLAALPPLQTQAEELSELPLPEQGEKEAKAYMKAFEAGLQEAEEDPKSLLEGKAFADAEAQAAKVGFKVCLGA